MKKIKNILLVICIISGLFTNTVNTFAGEIKIISKQQAAVQNKEVNRAEIFSFYSSLFSQYIPDSYSYIGLNYKDVSKNNPSYKDLQKLVYIDAIKNSNKSVYLNKKMNAYGFYLLSADILSVEINQLTDSHTYNLRSRNTIQKDLDVIQNIISGEQTTTTKSIEIPDTSDSKKIEYKKEIFFDVYKTLVNKHYNKSELDEEEIINSAIQGLTDGTEDKHTVYFPPIESKGFTDALSGEYEGIGAYVDMPQPGLLEIISPITGSPAEKSGLKGGDIVTHVDGVEITEDNSLKEVITWIKGPAGTDVILTIVRGKISKDIPVTRETIIIKDIEYEVIGRNTAYIQMKTFGQKSSAEFTSILKEIKQNNKINKIIFDLRNNGGGYLGQVSKMLSHFVEKNRPVAVVKYLKNDEVLYSRGYNTLDLNDYNIVILQNSGTASASEILIGTLKDYYPDITIIGEKSYGKGSVQTTKQYKDGSILKYTIAKWYTGKNENGIDSIGITPDIELLLDDERYLKNGYDNQLEKAKKIR